MSTSFCWIHPDNNTHTIIIQDNPIFTRTTHGGGQMSLLFRPTFWPNDIRSHCAGKVIRVIPTAASMVCRCVSYLNQISFQKEKPVTHHIKERLMKLHVRRPVFFMSRDFKHRLRYVVDNIIMSTGDLIDLCVMLYADVNLFNQMGHRTRLYRLQQVSADKSYIECRLLWLNWKFQQASLKNKNAGCCG